MHLLLLTIFFLLFAILAWRNLKMALVLLSGLLPIYLIRFDIGPIPSTALEILILICAVVWICTLCSTDARRDLLEKASHFVRGGGNKWIRPTLLLIAAASFGVVVAPDTFSALGIWKGYFIEPLLVAAMMIATFDRHDWTQALRALSLSAIVLSIFAIFQYATGLGIPTPWDIELRVTSIFDYPNALGLFLAPILSLNLILSFLRRQESIVYQAISISTIILGLIAIVLAQTEAALVAIPAAVILTLLISRISKKKKYVLLVLSVFLVFLSLITPATREKLLLQDYSGQVRLSQWSETVELIKDHPLFGAGLNGYPDAIAPYHNPTLYEIFQYPHTIFLNIWVELGVLGLIALVWFIWLIIKTISRSTAHTISRSAATRDPLDEKTSPNVEVVSLALFAALLTMFIHGLVDVPYFKNDLAVLSWILMAYFILNITHLTHLYATGNALPTGCRR